MDHRWGISFAAIVVLAATTAAACREGDEPANSGLPPAPDGGAEASVAPTSLCPAGKGVDGPPAPYAIDIAATLPPDLVFESPSGPLRLKDYFEPCATRSRLLLLRTSAAWSFSHAWG